MQIQVLFFGQLKDICGRAQDTLELPAGATAGTVFDHYAAEFPRLAAMAGSTVLARNHEFAHRDAVLEAGDEIGLLPPVSGGAPILEIADPEGHHFFLTREPIDVRAAEARVLQGIDGADCNFPGRGP